MIFTSLLTLGILGAAYYLQKGAEYDVFMSYASVNKDAAQKIYDSLKGIGLSVFFDSNNDTFGITQDLDKDNKLLTPLSKSKIFLIVITPETINSNFLKSELEVAISQAKPIFPLFIGDFKLTDTITSVISNNKSLVLDSLSEDNLKKISNTVGSILREYKAANDNSVPEPSRVNELKENASAQIEVNKYGGNVKIISDVTGFLYIDDNRPITIEKNTFYKIKLDKGEYILKFRSPETDVYSNKMLIVSDEAESHAIIFEIKEIERQLPSITVNCFMAGSTELVEERDAFKADVCKLHNRWHARGFNLRSFDYEDFSSAYISGGQQKTYNRFIADKTDFMAFVVTDTMGENTLQELRESIEAYEENKRPIIYIYVSYDSYKSGKWKEGIDDNFINSLGYVNVFQDRRDLREKIKNHLNEYLINRSGQRS